MSSSANQNKCSPPQSSHLLDEDIFCDNFGPARVGGPFSGSVDGEVCLQLVSGASYCMSMLAIIMKLHRPLLQVKSAHKFMLITESSIIVNLLIFSTIVVSNNEPYQTNYSVKNFCCTSRYLIKYKSHCTGF